MSTTMTVRIVDRSTWGTNAAYPAVRTVSIAATCPRCGGPRGEARPHTFPEDGDWITCDVWTNPCGHVDTYERVLAEVASQQRAAGTSRTAASHDRPHPAA